jgi:hypothetical protein
LAINCSSTSVQRKTCSTRSMSSSTRKESSSRMRRNRNRGRSARSGQSGALCVAGDHRMRGRGRAKHAAIQARRPAGAHSTRRASNGPLGRRSGLFVCPGEVIHLATVMQRFNIVGFADSSARRHRQCYWLNPYFMTAIGAVQHSITISLSAPSVVAATTDACGGL